MILAAHGFSDVNNMAEAHAQSLLNTLLRVKQPPPVPTKADTATDSSVQTYTSTKRIPRKTEP